MKKKSWDKIYKNNKGNKNLWPSEIVVSTLTRLFKTKDKKNIKVLDFGCGWGNNLLFLKQNNYNFFGIENSKVAYNHCYQKYKNRVLLNENNIIPFKNEFFDFVIDRQSIQHNSPDNVKILYDEINRVIKKKGMFLTEHLSLNTKTNIIFTPFKLQLLKKRFVNSKIIFFNKINLRSLKADNTNIKINSLLLKK